MTLTPDRRIAVLLFAVAAGTNVPTPLLLIYQERLQMTPTALTALFGVYAVGLLPALLLAGPAADRWGRRPVVLAAALLSVVASVSYVAATSSEMVLFMVRFVQGAGAGASFSVGTAWLVEAARQSGQPSAGRRAAVAMTAGFAFGPGFAGPIGQWGPGPLVTPYLIHAVVLAAALWLVLPVSETLERQPVSAGSQTSGVFIAGEARTFIMVVAPVAFCVYAFPSSAIAGLPVLVGFPVAPIAMTGLLAALTLGSGAVAAPLQARIGDRTAAVAAACGAAGFTLTSIAAAVPEVVLLTVPAAVLLGAGGGLALASGLARLPEVAAPSRLGSASAVFYACAYLGFGVPLALAEASTIVHIAVALAVLAALCLSLAGQQIHAAATHQNNPRAQTRRSP